MCNAQTANSTLLSMNARARVKGREGTKVNKGALFARLADVVDVEQAMKKVEIKDTHVVVTKDPLEPQHR